MLKGLGTIRIRVVLVVVGTDGLLVAQLSNRHVLEGWLIPLEDLQVGGHLEDPLGAVDDPFVDLGEHFLVGVEQDQQLMHLDEVQGSAHDLDLDIVGVDHLFLHQKSCLIALLIDLDQALANPLDGSKACCIRELVLIQVQMAQLREEFKLVDEVVDEAEDPFLEVVGQGGVGGQCFEGVEVEAADELPSAGDADRGVLWLGVVGCPKWYFDGGGAEVRLLFYFIYELLYELLFVLYLPTVLIGVVVLFAAVP